MTATVRPAFVLSLPRSGSTLLQRLVSAHSQVATTAEPWLLLAPLQALRHEDVYAAYGHRVAATALQDLCGRLAGGEDAYLAAVAMMARRIYAELSPPGTAVFVDKTPRYCLVVDELLRAFPDAPIVVLHRSPLAILASISDTWLDGRWRPHLHKVDLYLALERLLEAQMADPDRFLTVRYEDLVATPEPTLRAVLGHLDLGWEPAVLEAFTAVSVSGPVGDPTGILAYDAVSTAPLEKWRRSLASPVRTAWCDRYLRWIGADRLALMGYDINELRRALSTSRGGWARAPRDVVDALRGVVHDVVEPDLLRAKAAALPHWRNVRRHN